jgi:LAO/AO transport system kinase
LRALLSIADPGPWSPPILKAVAKTAEGVPELVDAIDQHQAFLRESEHAEDERRRHAQRQLLSIARAILLREAIDAAERSGALAALVDAVAARERDPRNAAEELLKAVRREWAQQ